MHIFMLNICWNKIKENTSWNMQLLHTQSLLITPYFSKSKQIRNVFGAGNALRSVSCGSLRVKRVKINTKASELLVTQCAIRLQIILLVFRIWYLFNYLTYCLDENAKSQRVSAQTKAYFGLFYLFFICTFFPFMFLFGILTLRCHCAHHFECNYNSMQIIMVFS